MAKEEDVGDVEAAESIEETLRWVRTWRNLMRGLGLEVVEEEVVEGREELDPVGEGGREVESLRSQEEEEEEEEVELDEELMEEGQKGVAL